MHKIEILYFAGCPNYRKTCDVICQVMENANLEFILTIRPIKNDNLALNSQFIGSPTVLINGKDVELCYMNKQSWDQPIDGLACRLYDCTVSRECPSEEMVLCALK